MTPLAAKLFHLACMVAWWIIRRPFERKVRRNVIARDGLDLRERILLAISFSGLGIIPAVYVATGFPAALDQEFSAARAWMGAALFLAALVLFRATHKALGRNWSVSAEAARGASSSITDGVYRWIRHPMYTAFWMWAVAQAAAAAELARRPGGADRLRHAVCVPHRAEALMRSRSGERWDAYAARTRRILPFLHVRCSGVACWGQRCCFPPQPRRAAPRASNIRPGRAGRAVLLRGLANVFSTGMDDLARRPGGRGLRGRGAQPPRLAQPSGDGSGATTMPGDCCSPSRSRVIRSGRMMPSLLRERWASGGADRSARHLRSGGPAACRQGRGGC